MKAKRLHRLFIVGEPSIPGPSITGLVRARAAGGSVLWAGRWWKVVDVLGPNQGEQGEAVAYLRQVEGPTYE